MSIIHVILTLILALPIYFLVSLRIYDRYRGYLQQIERNQRDRFRRRRQRHIRMQRRMPEPAPAVSPTRPENSWQILNLRTVPQRLPGNDQPDPLRPSVSTNEVHIIPPSLSRPPVLGRAARILASRSRQRLQPGRSPTSINDPPVPSTPIPNLSDTDWQ